MTLRLAIIADDLTGALDTATPFVAAGLHVAVATTLDGIAAALATGADVVAVNTASRAQPPPEAAARAAQAATALMQAKPAILFKKIDSRLKGNPGIECRAVAKVSGRTALIVAPAIPDQQRLTRNGFVTGRGVETPLAIAPLFADAQRPVSVIDATIQADLDTMVASTDWSSAIAIGARGLGIAFATMLGRPAASRSVFQPDTKTLFALGSRDPITDAQIGALARTGIAVIDAPAGQLPPAHFKLPLVLRCSGAHTGSPEKVAHRFGLGVAALLASEPVGTLVTGGGDTALAILQALGVTVLEPQGEAAPGLPWFWISAGPGRVRCVVKSGGFGDTGVLAGLLATQPRATASSNDPLLMTSRLGQ
jgi:uncharacterized protein YgbK (DUF1537 family)